MKLASTSQIQKYFSRAALVGAMFITFALSSARAAELVMFEQAGCAWCQVFDSQIAPVYGRTEEGLRAPLRRIDIARPTPPDLGFIEVERLTPLFVLVDRGREIGRIRGYPGVDSFWTQLAMLFERLDSLGTGGERARLLERKALRATD